MSIARKAPFDRLLKLVQSLSESTDGLTLDDMAQVLEQGRRSAERARDIIALHFDVDEIPDGPRKSFRITDGLRRHFTRPSAEELAALRAEVEALRPGGGMRFQKLQSLLARVQSSFDDREKRRIEPDLEELLKCQRSFVGPGPVAEVDRAISRAVMDAIMSGLCLEFEYRSAEAKEPQWRRVASVGLLNGPISYLVGFIPGSARSPAIYRLDRMSDARLSDQVAEAPEGFNLDDWLAEGFGIWREEAREVELRILPGSADRARSWRFHPKQKIEDQADGSVVIRFRAGGLREIAEHLFQWAGELIIEAPSELQDVMRERLALARTMTGDSDVQ